MKKLRVLMLAPALVLAAVALAPSAQAQPTNPRQVSVGGLVDVLLQNTNVEIPVNVRENQIGLVNLNDVLNDAEITVLQDILRGSPILSQNQTNIQNVLNGNTVLKDFLNSNDVVVSDVVAVDVLSGGRLTIFYLPSGAV